MESNEKTIIDLSTLSDRDLSLEFARSVRDVQQARDFKASIEHEILLRCERKSARKIQGAAFPLGRKLVSDYPLSIESAKRIIEAADGQGVPDPQLMPAIQIVESVKSHAGRMQKIAADYGLETPLGTLITTELEAVKKTKFEVDFKKEELLAVLNTTEKAAA